jgi:hypothetical protein
MRKPLTLAQLKAALAVRAAKAAASVEAFRGNNNPQVREMLIAAQAELETLELVSTAISERTVYFLEH